MTTTQKIIKIFAIILAITIIAGIITSIINIANYFLPPEKITPQTSSIKEITKLTNPNNIEIDLKSSRLKIETIPSSTPKISTENNNIKYTSQNGLLKITEKNINISQDNTILLQIPQGISLNTIKINTGAGSLSINNITSKNLDLDLGAGRVDINNINITEKAEIDAGAGNINITNYNINNLELELGVGQANLEGNITSQSKIEGGIGSLNLTLNSSLNNYSFNIEKGLGEITINNEKITKEEYHTLGNIPLEIEGGVGNITIKTN